MPINTLEYAKLLQNRLDQHMVHGATTGWMEENAGQVLYNGGDEVRIPTLSTNGLGDYDRDAGFPQGSVTFKYDTYKMLMDRGRTFQLDAMDVNETNFVMTAAAVMREFQTRHVIPEVDAHRYSRLAQEAIEAGQTETYTINGDTVISKLREHIRAVRDVVGEMPLMVTMSSATLGAIEDSPKLQRQLIINDFKQGEINYRVKVLDGDFLRTAPAARLKTKYEFLSGETGQEAGGFKPATDAKDIHWIIAPRTSPLAISKTDKIRIFAPDTNQKADAWKLDYRKYHDLWVLKSRLKTLFVCTSA